jgi:hypothetical protein
VRIAITSLHELGAGKASQIYNRVDENPFTRAIGTSADLSRTGQNTRRVCTGDRFLDGNFIEKAWIDPREPAQQAKSGMSRSMGKNCGLEQGLAH